jgi:hypothetical protein
MLYPMANMAVRANSVKHLECRFVAKVHQQSSMDQIQKNAPYPENGID